MIFLYRKGLKFRTLDSLLDNNWFLSFIFDVSNRHDSIVDFLFNDNIVYQLSYQNSRIHYDLTLLLTRRIPHFLHKISIPIYFVSEWVTNKCWYIYIFYSNVVGISAIFFCNQELWSHQHYTRQITDLQVKSWKLLMTFQVVAFGSQGTIKYFRVQR